MKQVLLRPDTAAMLRRPIKGEGGFQRLMRRIQLGLRGQQLCVEKHDLDALLQATRGPVGGFQRRAREILVDYIIQQIRAEASGGPARVLSFEQPRLPFHRGGDE